MSIHLTEEHGSNRFVKLKYDGFHYVGTGETQTIAQKLGMRNLVVFQTLALHQNDHCIVDLTFDQMAEILNTSPTTMKTAIKELELFTYEGNVLLKKTQVGRGQKQQNNYEIQFNPIVSLWGEHVNEVLSTNIDLKNQVLSTKFDLTKENKITKEITIKNNELEESSMALSKKFIVTTFRDLLNEKGVEKKFSYPQVYAKMKKAGVDPLLESMTEDEAKKLLKFIADEYGNGAIKSDLIKYPLDIQVITRKWVVERAIQLVDKVDATEKEKESQIVEQTVEATKRNKESISSILQRIKNKGGN